eukprot:UN02538
MYSNRDLQNGGFKGSGSYVFYEDWYFIATVGKADGYNTEGIGSLDIWVGDETGIRKSPNQIDHVVSLDTFYGFGGDGGWLFRGREWPGYLGEFHAYTYELSEADLTNIWQNSVDKYYQFGCPPEWERLLDYCYFASEAQTDDANWDT